MKTLLAFLVFAVAAYAIDGETARILFHARPLFEDFKKEYGKVYSTPEEEEFRFAVFAENLKRAEDRNRAEVNGALHGVTQFMDLTPAEFKSQFLNFRPKERVIAPEVDYPASQAISCDPSNCNWANLGAVTKVKDQGQCGSCWAFSTTEAVETSQFFFNGSLPVLAPQQIVDCDKKDAGCNGGDTPTAYEYVIGAGGQESETEYPYTAHDGVCAFATSKIVASISAYKWGITPCNTAPDLECNSQNETGLWSVVQMTGPQSICVDAEPWQTYRSGIFSNTNTCKHAYYDLDHCVHLTGYGSDTGTKYWLVKNSWGASWGEAGYIRRIYGENICGVADEVTFAIARAV